MKILTKKSIEQVNKHLDDGYKKDLTNRWTDGTTKMDRLEYPFIGFLGDLIGEVAYRAKEGLDGNWFEFAQQWKIGEDDYKIILAKMIKLDWTPELERW